MPDDSTLTVSLISHTNVGKTTLARTLLRRDVGEAYDRSHVTDISEAYVMVASQGRRLLLWDTPGFGDTARLLRRLRQSEKPIQWITTQLWDRYVNRPLWCSQQAVKNVREEADIVLYLVDASQRPEEMPFVDMEMEILSWIGKPVVLLLNQTGPPRAPEVEKEDEERWRRHMRRFPIVQNAINLDAFARCWVQEGELLEQLAPAVPVAKKETFRVLREAWREKNLTVHREAVAVLAQALTASLLDVVKVSNESWWQKIGLKRGELDEEMTEARRQLSERLSQRAIDVTNELIKLFGLEGQSSHPLGHQSRELFGNNHRVNESLWTAIGGLASGLTSGVIVDILSHGTTVFAGTVLGALGGGVSGYMLAKTYNLVRGRAGNEVRWSFAHYVEQVQLLLLCYLAVAHYGRGRGEWEDGEHPPHWRDVVRYAVEAETERLERLWKDAGEAKEPLSAAETENEMRGILSSCCAKCLRDLYPQVEVFA